MDSVGQVTSDGNYPPPHSSVNHQVPVYRIIPGRLILGGVVAATLGVDPSRAYCKSPHKLEGLPVCGERPVPAPPSAHLDISDVVHQLVGNVLAALGQCLGGHLVVRVPVSVGRMGVGGTGCSMIDSCGGHNAHRFP